MLGKRIFWIVMVFALLWSIGWYMWFKSQQRTLHSQRKVFEVEEGEAPISSGSISEDELDNLPLPGHLHPDEGFIGDKKMEQLREFGIIFGSFLFPFIYQLFNKYVIKKRENTVI